MVLSPPAFANFQHLVMSDWYEGAFLLGIDDQLNGSFLSLGAQKLSVFLPPRSGRPNKGCRRAAMGQIRPFSPSPTPVIPNRPFAINHIPS